MCSFFLWNKYRSSWDWKPLSLCSGQIDISFRNSQAYHAAVSFVRPFATRRGLFVSRSVAFSFDLLLAKVWFLFSVPCYDYPPWCSNSARPLHSDWWQGTQSVRALDDLPSFFTGSTALPCRRPSLHVKSQVGPPFLFQNRPCISCLCLCCQLK